MSLVEQIHERHVAGRRVRVLAARLAALMPRNASVLDVGCGDGMLACELGRLRPDLTIAGVDVLVRPETGIPVVEYDGVTLPHADRSFDAVLFVDVLHHTQEPLVLLREAARVTRGTIVIKDHLCQGLFAEATLRFMDRVGNCRHGVAVPGNYLRPAQWRAAFADISATVEAWHDALGLYPWPAAWVFERKLHFAARLAVPAPVGPHAAAHAGS